MDNAMIAAIGSLLVGVGAIVSAVLLYRKTVALLEFRMSSVEKKLDIHNGYAEKFSAIKDDIASIKTDVAVLKNEVSHK